MMISIIIPVYNRPLMLREALKSVLKQTYQNREIIVVDDGSTDDTYIYNQDIINKYRFIRYYRHNRNEGVSKARNTGISLSKGEYIAFLDSDDKWRKRKLEIQYMHHLNSPYSISYTNERWIKDNTFKNQSKAHRKFSGNIFSNALKLCMVSPSSIMCRRAVFHRIGLFDESLPVAEDYDLFIRASIYYDFLFIDNPLVIKYGGHKGQLSRSRKILDIYRIRSLEKIYHSYYSDLSDERKSLLKNEIIYKSNIISNGAFKRSNYALGLYYFLKAIKYGNK